MLPSLPFHCQNLFPPLLILAITIAAGAQDTHLALKEGERQLAQLPALKEGQAQTLHFEIQLAGRAVGVGELVLQAARREGQLIYEYRHQISVRLASQGTTRVVMSATLQPDFRPLSVLVTWTVSPPDGPPSSRSLSAAVERERVVIKISQSEHTQIKEVPLPEGPIVFGVDSLVDRLSESLRYRRKKDFGLRQLDVKTGELVVIYHHWTRNDKGDLQLSLSRDGKSPDEYFVFDREGSLAAYGKINPPFVELKVDQSRMTEVRKALGL